MGYSDKVTYSFIIMPRGGKREGAGRKTTWTSRRGIEDTTVIRVPKEFSSKLLEIAHKLDAGEDIDFVTNSNNDIVTQSNTDVIPSQVIDLLAQLKEFASRVKVKTTEWKKALELIIAIESAVLHEEVILENVTESKEVQIDLVADSNKEEELNTQASNELVTNSKDEDELITQAPNELVTDSKSKVGNSQVLLFTPSEAEVPSKLTSKRLAERIGISASTLAVYKSQMGSKEFLDFLKGRDPDRISWSPIKEGNKLFYVVLEKETKS